jgi:tRNA (adenine58-N1)-methyltransferase non-catalytic subunit
LRRKKKKYIFTVQVQKPTARTLCEAYFCKMPQKIRQLRVDSLAEIMLHSDAKSGSRILTYDRCGGLVVGALMERLAGNGQIVSVFPGQAPAVGIIDQFNFSAEQKSVLHHLPIMALPNYPQKKNSTASSSSVSVATAVSDSTKEENFEPPTKRRKTGETDQEPTDAATGVVPVAAVRSGVAQQSVATLVAQMRDLKHPIFDTIVLVPEDGDDPLHLLKMFWPFLAPSGSVVVFSPYMQPLAECYQDLMESHAIVHIRLFETWHRVHQVLPMRTHPLMQMHGASGYILSGYKVKASYGLPLIPSRDKVTETPAPAPAAPSPVAAVPSSTTDAMEVDTTKSS